MRCLALAQAWQDHGGKALFVMSQSTPSVSARLTSESCAIATSPAPAGSAADAIYAAELAAGYADSWVVIDGYHFDAEYQEIIKKANLRLLAVDDNANGSHFFADVVLNQNLHAHVSQYRNIESASRLLLGPRFALLRRELRNAAPRGRVGPVNCIAITFGGSDPKNMTAHVLKALASLGLTDVRLAAIVGGSNPNLPILRDLVREIRSTCELHVDVSDMASILAEADMAITAAGSTCWELCALGVPSIVIDVASNQSPIARSLAEHGCAIHVAGKCFQTELLHEAVTRLVSSRELREKMSKAASQLVDGNGAARVVAALLREGLRLRAAQHADCELLWRWANDPAVRAASFRTETIPWEAHQIWFTAKMNDAGTQIFIAEDLAGVPVGQLRVELTDDNEATVHVSISPESRNLGYGATLIDLASRELFANRGVRKLHAFIRPENYPSIRAFEEAHFTKIANATVHGQLAMQFVRKSGI